MASVSYRKVGNRWHIRFQKQGEKEITESLPGTLYEKTVAAKAGWYEQEIALDRYDPWDDDGPADGSVVLSDVIAEYLRENLQSGNWTKHSHKTNTSRLNTLDPLIDKPLSSITSDKAQQVLDDMDVSAVTKKGRRSTWNAFFKWCRENKYTNRVIRVKLRTPDKIEIRNADTIKYLTWQQVNDICGATRFYHRQIERMYNYPAGKGAEYYCDLWWFLFYSLLRKEEVPRVTVKDLLPGGRLRVHGKGRKIDIIPLPPPALEIAKRYAKGKTPDDPLLAQHMNRPYTHWKRSVRMALGEDHDTGFHQLRHGGVVHYLTLGKQVQFISKLCRHANIQVTLEIYADIIPDGLSDAFSDIDHSPAS